jgi:hypothetical protein
MARLLLFGSAFIVFAAATFGAATFGAASADAAVYCVDPASTAGCDQVENPGGSAGLAAALIAANASAGVADTIELGPETYTGPFAATAAGGALTITGSGASGTSVTTLTVTAKDATVLALGAAGSSVSHVELQLPARTGDTALNLTGDATDVTIDDPNGTTNGVGVEMDRPASFSGVIKLGNSSASGTIAIDRTANGSGTENVTDSTIDAGEAVFATSGTWTLDHDKLTAVNRGIQAVSGNGGTGVPAVVMVADSLVHIATPAPSSTCGVVACFALGVSGSSMISADRSTIVGPGQPIAGGDALGASPGQTATLALDSTVVTGFSPSLECSQSNGGTATLTADYSAFATPISTDGSCAAPSGAHNISSFTDPGFVGNTFEPQWDSPLIDAGDPAVALPAGATDLGGDPRLVDGDGKGAPAAVVDIGAFEYQRRSPSVTAQTVTSARVGARVPFSVAKASDPDPGDTLTFTWSFDDGGSATGAHVTHAFTTAGSHSATVTATDPTGLTATATATVEIAAKTTRPPPDRTPPKISKLKLRPSKFAVTKGTAHFASKPPPRGTKITFTLSEAASLELSFEQKKTGHKPRHGKCKAQGHGQRCTYYATVRGSIKIAGARAGKVTIVFDGRIGTRALAPGNYKLALTATDAARNRSKPATVTFTIVKRK